MTRFFKKMKKKVIINKNKQKSIQEIQDDIFKKMSVDKKLLLLDDFFKFSRKLQNLNNRRKI
jgi:hypothetical protein